jgi:mono/diheme cytochrome c family protein
MALAALTVSAAPPAAPPAQGDPQRGAYLFALNGGCGCHMGQAGFLAGGEKFEGPFGVVYGSNITPDPETGIGAWTDQQIIDSIRLGKRPDGTQLFPIMPYPYFSELADEDVQDLVAFLRTAPPVNNALPARQLNFPVPPFEPRAPAPATAPVEGVARGGYLVNTISHCGACHTPSNPDGSPDMARFLAGTFDPGLGAVPNITPDRETGIGGWTEEQIAAFLRTGVEPDGKQTGGLMALMIEGGLKDMTEADALAVAAYLKTVPAVRNTPQSPGELPATGGTIRSMLAAGLIVLLAGVAILAGLIMRRWYYRG